MEHYLFDGNNLIGHLTVLKRVFLKDKQKAREDVLLIIEKFLEGKNCKATLYFDGHENIRLRHSRIKIIYSGNNRADDLIIKQIELSKSRTNLVVVSSDLEILNFAKVCSCKIITSKEFEKMLFSAPSKSTSKKHSNSEKEHIADTNFDKNYFIKLFGSARDENNDIYDELRN